VTGEEPPAKLTAQVKSSLHYRFDPL